MTSSAERRLSPMLADFLSFTLSGARPNGEEASGECAVGLRYVWHGEGILQLEPSTAAAPLLRSADSQAGVGAVRTTGSSDATMSVLLSAGVHGDETAPIELLSRLVADLALGVLPLACRLLVVLGNLDAMRAGTRYLDDDLNRLFRGRHTQLAASRESPRAAALEAATARFFEQGMRADGRPDARWHLDMHTAIRGSVFEQFALLPHTGNAPSQAMLDWLSQAGIAAVLLHTAKGNTFSQYTAETFGATACTLELGRVRPFGQNDIARFAAADNGVRALISGAPIERTSPMPRVFTVVDEITKLSERFELKIAADVLNFTPFCKGTVLAVDGDYEYVVSRDEERIVFPNPAVKPGLRAGLVVVETTPEAIAGVAEQRSSAP
ncbi:MAG TPA: succinylglutamate desuccinylase [Trinickia sp.]|uniref:succinylglutamate desuccinylase n=1 Tax=Trinickia sp. TaxID=2571163 RepID=UPI002D0E9317|nr:succinylglutamate desuccinylase [Trinickia sp.]HTI18143.1 succinylglutamate desuccinylase [Trinickia sp.]